MNNLAEIPFVNLPSDLENRHGKEIQSIVGKALQALGPNMEIALKHDGLLSTGRSNFALQPLKVKSFNETSKIITIEIWTKDMERGFRMELLTRCGNAKEIHETLLAYLKPHGGNNFRITVGDSEGVTEATAPTQSVSPAEIEKVISQFWRSPNHVASFQTHYCQLVHANRSRTSAADLETVIDYTLERDPAISRCPLHVAASIKELIRLGEVEADPTSVVVYYVTFVAGYDKPVQTAPAAVVAPASTMGDITKLMELAKEHNGLITERDGLEEKETQLVTDKGRAKGGLTQRHAGELTQHEGVVRDKQRAVTQIKTDLGTLTGVRDGLQRQLDDQNRKVNAKKLALETEERGLTEAQGVTLDRIKENQKRELTETEREYDQKLTIVRDRMEVIESRLGSTEMKEATENIAALAIMMKENG